jgi:hypothetical protein
MARHMFRPIGGSAAVICDEESRHDTSCFADEVVIDFPSPARAIDRMRRAFVAEERAAAIAAELHLSRQEAREGADIPIDLPVRCTCRNCGGRGELWADPCVGCAGSGVEVVRHQVKVSLPAGVSHGARFYFSVGPAHDISTRIELRVMVA